MDHRVPPILDSLKNLFFAVLGNNLVGIYVHGSLAFGCFSWETGDVDLLIVAGEEPSPEQKRAIISGVMAIEAGAPPKGIELSVVLERDAGDFAHPMPYVLHYSRAHRQQYLDDMEGHILRLKGTDPDLAAHLTVTRAVGWPLMGPEVERVFGQVPAADYFDSIRSDVQDAPEQIHENPVYTVLNLCRVLAWLRDGSVLSKEAGGLWGVEHLPGEYTALVRAALNAYRTGANMPEILSGGLLNRYAAWMLDSIEREAGHISEWGNCV